MGIGAGIAVAGGLGLVGSYLSGSAQEDAASQYSDASAYANQLQYQMYQQNRADMMPWLTAGTGAVNQLSSLMQPGGQLYQTDFTPAMFKAGIDPAYNWDVSQGINALTAKSAAAGNYGSGNLGTALVDYGQNMASNEYQNAYNRWMIGQNALYNRLAGISGTGQTQSQALGNLGYNTASTMGANQLSGASALGAGQVGAANAWSGGLTNLGNQAMSGLGLYMNNQNQLALMNMMNQNSWGQGMYNYGASNDSGGGWY